MFSSELKAVHKKTHAHAHPLFGVHCDLAAPILPLTWMSFHEPLPTCPSSQTRPWSSVSSDKCLRTEKNQGAVKSHACIAKVQVGRVIGI